MLVDIDPRQLFFNYLQLPHLMVEAIGISLIHPLATLFRMRFGIKWRRLGRTKKLSRKDNIGAARLALTPLFCFIKMITYWLFKNRDTNLTAESQKWDLSYSSYHPPEAYSVGLDCFQHTTFVLQLQRLSLQITLQQQSILIADFSFSYQYL